MDPTPTEGPAPAIPAGCTCPWYANLAGRVGTNPDCPVHGEPVAEEEPET
jgi:hypothetical protein